MTKLESVIKHGKKAKGRAEIIRHLKGKKLQVKAAIAAQCYDCMGYCGDGGIDCENPSCSLYPFMPYNPNAIKNKVNFTKESIEKRSARCTAMNKANKKPNLQ